jgi:hypothetical protein
MCQKHGQIEAGCRDQQRGEQREPAPVPLDLEPEQPAPKALNQAVKIRVMSTVDPDPRTVFGYPT